MIINYFYLSNDIRFNVIRPNVNSIVHRPNKKPMIGIYISILIKQIPKIICKYILYLLNIYLQSMSPTIICDIYKTNIYNINSIIAIGIPITLIHNNKNKIGNIMNMQSPHNKYLPIFIENPLLKVLK